MYKALSVVNNKLTKIQIKMTTTELIKNRKCKQKS